MRKVKKKSPWVRATANLGLRDRELSKNRREAFGRKKGCGVENTVCDTRGFSPRNRFRCRVPYNKKM